MNTSRLTLLAAALSCTLTAGIAVAQTPATPPMASTPGMTSKPANLSSKDTTFVNKAAEAGAAEVAMGQLARDHAGSADVKGFGARMVSDHSKAGDQLKSIATSKGLAPSDQLSKKDQSEVDKLSKLQGADFDRAYIKSQVSAHKDAVSLFNSESKGGKDADLKQFATSTLPTLQDHLQMVQQLSKTNKS